MLKKKKQQKNDKYTLLFILLLVSFVLLIVNILIPFLFPNILKMTDSKDGVEVLVSTLFSLSFGYLVYLGSKIIGLVISLVSLFLNIYYRFVDELKLDEMILNIHVTLNIIITFAFLIVSIFTMFML